MSKQETIIARKPINGLDVYELYNRMQDSNIMLSFKGDITSELMTSILQIMEGRLDNLNEDPKIRKKVYNVMVECLQNLYHHNDGLPVNLGDIEDEDRSAIFMIGLGDDGYDITSGNYIHTNRIDDLKGKMDKINSLEPTDLKDFYKEVLNSEGRSDKGGGGLGMIDIARKTNRKLDYEFISINDQYSFFSLNVTIEHKLIL